MENLCESCIFFKPRNTVNCQIQQSIHLIDVLKEITTYIVKCRKYKKIEDGNIN